MDWSMPDFPVFNYLLELARPVFHCLLDFAPTHVHWVDDIIQPSHSLSSPSSHALNLSQHQGLFHELTLCIRWPKYQSFSFNIIPSNEYSELISFRTDAFALFAVQETLNSLLQHHNLKPSILRPSALFMVHFSHPYMSTGKTIDLTIHIFVSKMMSLLFNMVSSFVIAFLPRGKLIVCYLHYWNILFLSKSKSTDIF